MQILLRFFFQLKQELVWVLEKEYKSTTSFENLYKNYEKQAKKLKAYACEVGCFSDDDFEDDESEQAENTDEISGRL